jgi:excisionase family DNA binding protein|tara:strand:+ start:535 stop:756 length:222 start_codon:yes stop_codon:yes gene_type:complete
MNVYPILKRLAIIEEKVEKNIPDRWLTTKEVCQYTSLSPRTVFRAIANGHLKVSKATGKNLFRRFWVDNWIEG